ncbi:ABC transporter ATP-binding protein [Pelagibacterium halotolerans]|uniref:ATP-binding protein of ABC transporter n=1 Tax=Pelagibacterium halotolerans (strain DSM 22347 / JCM 15775 / CGMCC 1.7692 / B2) TaxID=1082931 RepID=G4RE38_PELHB|nr:ABC transporter ATP-binding protein [Pelagibacterium halotolerans]AEQ50832.1 ATP-binding protein of ABC transporter [Pelagibacterium halotolerans B2]QJR19254.1 ABC transporter ATP-binding protein [Pelagibacterium halotolerans]SDZ97357.1 ATP-binding cassette, subfamily B, multidrug efflux pump [Pelagibacterium halotolerans]
MTQQTLSLPARISKIFETWIKPFEYKGDIQPPDTIWAFLWYYIRQAKAPYLAVLLFTGLTSLFEALFFFYMGRLIDLLESTDAAGGWAGLIAAHGTELSIMLVVVVVGRFAAPALQALVEEQTIGRGFNTMVRWQTYAYVSRQSIRFFNDDFAGRLVTKVSQAAQSLNDFVASVIQIGWALTIFAGTTIFLFAQLDWRMAALVVIWIAAILLMARYYVPRMRSRAAENAENASVLNGRITDSFANVQTLRLFGNAEDNDTYVKKGFERFLDSATRLARLVTGMRASMGLLSTVMIIAFGWLAIQLWTANAITVGAIAFTLSLVLRLNMMQGRLMGQLNGMMRHFGVAQNAMETIAQPLELTDAPDAEPLKVTGAGIKFENVRFHYGREKGIIEGVDLNVRPGEKIGLVGHSGAGKSTLVNLLLRFYDLESGRILIDGQDISKVTQESLRANIGVVTQDTALLHRSVKANILFGKAGASEEEMIAAARSAEAHDFIMDLKDSRGRTGYEAQVGERGVKLSGGQRQRVAIARVLLKDAPILVLDEATSALDSEVEAAIQSQLDKLMDGKTVIAIAHRLSTIAAMDRLVILDHGRIVEEGTHEALLARGGHYARLWERQSGGFLDLEDEEAAE